LKTKILLLLALSLICFSETKAQKGLKNFKWAKQRKTHANIPDSLKDNDAVFVFRYYTLRPFVNEKYVEWANTVETYHYRIKLLTQNGVDKYSNIILNKKTDSKIAFVDAYTVKSNGKIINLDSKDIELNEYKNSDLGSSWKQLRFSIPGVEVGDEIEIIYQLKLPYLRTSDDTYFHSYLPVLNSVVTIDVMEGLHLKLNVYNQLGQPEVLDGLHHTSYQWRLKNLVSIGEQYKSIPALELPYLAYVIDFKPMLKWKSLYNAYYDSFKEMDFTGRPHNGFFNKFMSLQKETFPEADSYDLLEKVMTYIQDSIPVVHMSKEESNNPTGYFLYEKKINYKNLHILIRKVFNNLNIGFETAFGRDKYDGPIDFIFPSTHQINEIFFLYRDKNTKYRIIYPSSPGYKYYLNELPNNLEGTTVLTVKGRNQNSVNIQTKKFKIPDSYAGNNYVKQFRNFEVDIAGNRFELECKNQFSGNFNRDERDALFALSDNFEKEKTADIIGVEVDTFYVTEFLKKPPVKYSSRYNYSGNNLFNSVDENLISIPFKRLFEHKSLYADPDLKRNLGYFTEMLYEDQVNVLLKFPVPVTIQNEGDLKRRFENVFGKYSIEIQQMDDKTILIKSSYKIIGRYLPPAKFDLLLDMNAYLEETMETELYLGFE